MPTAEPVLYRLGQKSAFWAALTPSDHGLGRTWQLGVAARSRGGAKIVAPVLETTALRPLGTVTIKGETYPLLIGWHEKKRGGLRFGGERKIGPGGLLRWEMRWVPLADCEDGFRVELRIQAEPRCTGHLRLALPTTLHRPDLWTLQAAQSRGHCVQTARSGFSAQALSFIALGGDAGWEETGSFSVSLPKFSFGGGRLLSFGLRFGAAQTDGDARAGLVKFYAAFADAVLHPIQAVASLDPSAAVARLTDPAGHIVKGAERLYLLPPVEGESDTYYAGLPHEPVGAMRALWNRNRTQPEPRIPHLVRFGAQGVCADFQVMGAAGGEPEPNKGAFWDKLVGGAGRDRTGGLTHSLRSNARLARSLFGVSGAIGDALCRQSALNICQWLLLKQADNGFYDGALALATRGLPDDGRMVAQPCSLDGAEAIRAFALAYTETGQEVWMAAAWRIANFLLENRLREFDPQPPTVAAVLLSLLALDAEAPNPRLRLALREWGAWLRALPLSRDAPALNADGLHSGLYECAEAGFALFGLTSDIAYLRYAFSALALVPASSRAASWRAVAAHSQALIALAGLLPNTRLDFDAQTVTQDWRVYAPDPAAADYIRVQPAGGDGWVDSLPLVCRATDQLLLLLLAPPSVEAVTLWKNGKRPLVRDLLTGALDTATSLHFIAKEPWARVGLFLIDP